jgi:hypothetical protein
MQGSGSGLSRALRPEDDRDHDVRQLTTAELERVKRHLCTDLDLAIPDSPADVPIQAHMKEIDAELAPNVPKIQKVNGSAIVSTGTEPAGCDPLTALSNEYGAEWKV